MFRRLVVGFGLAVLAGPLAAQDFEIGPRLGYVKWKEASGLQGAAMLGLDAFYRLGSNLAVGVRLDVARPATDEQYFVAEQTFGDTTLLFAITQPVTVLQYGVQGRFEIGGTLGLFAKGGAGGYTVTLDPQSARGRVSTSDWHFAVGGGVRLRTGSGTSVMLEVQDIVYANFHREDLNPVEPRFRPRRFPDVLPAQTPFEGTAHNIYAALTFMFTPGGAQ
jgi:hypothetical protein